jgi:hypothetical protein
MKIKNASPLEKAALTWWRGKRPCAFNEVEHLKKPTINTTTDTEKRLARSVARTLKTRGEGQPQPASGCKVGTRIKRKKP